MSFHQYMLHTSFKTKNSWNTFLALLAFLPSVALVPSVNAQSSIAGERFFFREGVVNDGDTPVGPSHRGLFASVPTVFSYDAKSGAADMIVPTTSYHFWPAWSADVSLPYYIHVNVDQLTSAGQIEHAGHDNVLGDVIIAGHWVQQPERFTHTLTGAFTVQTGDRNLGFGAGRMTGKVASHLERRFGALNADADGGFTNNSNLFRESTRKNYTSVGKMAFVQAGSTLDVHRLSVGVHAYDQLPFGAQNVVTTIFRESDDPFRFLYGSSAAKDYGFTARVDMPMKRRIGFSADYSYSVPLQDATVGIRMTLLINKQIEDYR